MQKKIRSIQNARRIGRHEQRKLNGGTGFCIYECTGTGQIFNTRARCTAACAGGRCIIDVC